jgi:hypothetical protein
MSSKSKNERKKNQYVVIQLTTGEGPCKIIPADDLYPAIYSQVYGPSPRNQCEKWVAENCASAS